MRKRTEVPSKRPSGGRPAPRRLFSFDSLLREKTTPPETEGAPNEASDSIRREKLTDKPILELSGRTSTDGESWMEEALVTSPDQEETKMLDSPEEIGKTSTRPSPLNLEKPGFIPSTSEETVAGTIPGSPSKRRWDTVRHHVLPSPSSSSDFPPDTPAVPPRPSTPKLRFGQKKAFRQVVETAQTQSLGETRRFAEVLRKACWECRFGETAQIYRPEREPTLGTVGSSLHLPFMTSNATLPTPFGSTTSGSQTSYRTVGLRRPQSIQSIATSSRTPAPIARIARALTSTMSFNRPKELPHEQLVLSTLLVPFLCPHPDSQVENERAVAVETFESVVKTWRAVSREDELERCIWCCKAASVYSMSRTRILGTLSSLLFSKDNPFVANVPSILQTLLQALFSLAYSLSLSSRSISESESLFGYLSAVRNGSCGPLSHSGIEKEFGVRFSQTDDEATIREVLVAESVVRCLSSGQNRARWVLRTLTRDYWPIPPENGTTSALLACAQWRKLKAALPAIRSVLLLPTYDPYDDGEAVVTILRTRIIPEVAQLLDEGSSEIRGEIVRLALELICKQDGTLKDYVSNLFCNWFRDSPSWKENIERTIEDILGTQEWPIILSLIPTAVRELPNDVQGPVLTKVLPSLFDRLVVDPPVSPCPALTRFLDLVSQAYPKLFFKPLFVCAAANKDVTVVRQLSILNAVSKFLPDYWTRDPDMMSVALMNDISGAKSPSDREPSATTRVGQIVLTVELAERIQVARQTNDLAVTSNAAKFATSLETRLGAVIEAKEKDARIPDSQRLLLCVLFKQIRLLTRSSKPANWLDSVVSWVHSWKLARRQSTVSIDYLEDEVFTTMHKLQAIYRDVHARDDSTGASKRRTTILSISAIERQASEQSMSNEEAEEILNARLGLLTSASKSVKASFLELLVAVSGLLIAEQFLLLGPVLWNFCFSDPSAVTTAPSCFLFMQYAEKCPEALTELIENDLASRDPTVRRRTLERISILSSWRFQILSQDVILDRSHRSRRPFKLQRPPVLFVATDIGTNLFVYEDDTDEYKDINGHIIPAELRRRLSEIGWTQDDKIIDHRIQRIRTPMSLLPSHMLDSADSEVDDGSSHADSQSPNQSPEPSPTKPSPSNSSLTRQDSTPGNRQAQKRRPVFVPTLANLFPVLASMANDADFIVASIARDLIIDFMRDDPALLSRYVFQCIAGDKDDLMKAVTALKAFLHVRHTLPPAMAHHVLNHLTGFLKSSVRQTEGSDPLRGYAYSLSTVAKLVPQVSKLSIREIRRAKVDPLLIPSGSLWFPPTAPAGPLFPRNLSQVNNPFESLPRELIWITMIRTSQNFLFLSMLKRNPQDIKVIRKNLAALQLPSLSRRTGEPILSVKDTIPERWKPSSDSRSSTGAILTTLSLTLSRSYLLLIQQIFQCISRHLNDRDELAVLLDGLNRILLAHKDDIGIVAHVMFAYMTASTRFRRLFVSGGGYVLFMGAVMRTFVEAEQQPNIRYAISYAAERFYALHQESFIFQTFDAMASVMAHPAADGPWIASGIYALFASLRTGLASSMPDAAGIHDLNRAQEQEALMVTMAEEVPQTFLASLKRTDSQDRGAVTLPVQDGYEVKRLNLQDLVRLLLTVIAHNPGRQRAEQFLRLLRLLTPHLYEASRPVQIALRSGIEALGGILLTRAVGKSNRPDPSLSGQTAEEQDFNLLEEMGPTTNNSSPSNLLEMRLDYLALVVAFARCSGSITKMTSTRVVELIKSVLKDSRVGTAKVSALLSSLLESLIVRETSVPDVREVIEILQAFIPVCRAHIHMLDLAAVYVTLHKYAKNSVYSSDATFAKLLITQYCRMGLEACEKAATEDILFSSPLRIPLVNLLIDAISMDGAATIFELERVSMTHHLLAGIILPITLNLKTSGEIVAENQWAEGWRRELYSKTWLRLLNLVTSAFDQEIPIAPLPKSPTVAQGEQRKSGDQRTFDSAQPAVKTMCMALQVFKTMVIRAEEDISGVSPGIWIRLGNILGSLLDEGDAIFALRPRGYSEPPSPTFSPRTSTFAEGQQSLFAFPSSMSLRPRRALMSPRLIDYMAWSMIEWLQLRRSPLLVQLRMFVQERIANLATELRLLNSDSFKAIPCRSRRISTIFSKPRRSMLSPSASSSAASTPRNSVLLSTPVSMPSLNIPSPISATLSPSRSVDSRQAGFARLPSPISPSGRTSRDSLGVKIVHLGPVGEASASGARPASPAGEVIDSNRRTAKMLAKETIISSPSLIRMTYKRIRLIQHLFGYSSLLPMQGSDFVTEDGLDAEVRVWSRNDALRAVIDETKELLDEFRESFNDLGDESLVMVDSQGSLGPE